MLVIGRLLALALLVAPAADAAVLRAEAGLDGLGRPGRWLPVRVMIDARTDDVRGELIAEWGRSHVRRRVLVPAPSRREFDLYIRTGDVRDVVVVRLEENGRETGRVTVPVQVVGGDEPTTATIRAGRVPRSWRGYDAADTVVFDAGVSALQPDEQNAWAFWRALRNAGDIDRALPATQPVAAAAFPSARITGVTIVYFGAIAAVAVFFGSRRRTARWAYVALAAAVAGGSAAAWARGRSAAVVLRHQTVAEQFEGTALTLVDMNATVQYPSDGEYSLQATVTDGVLDPVPGSSTDETRLDADGYPLFERRGGLGTVDAFTLEATSAARTFDIRREASRVRIVNVSTTTLEGC
ncbi:MAG TPA: hypothetical protein VN628_17765, partial [Vicinamibacterales bacterium]|nr:hypothetical protein [Vicinamibacterales bacterium]